MKKPRQYSVSEGARRLAISNDTLRRYEAQGVFSAERVLGQRIITDAHIAAVRRHRRGLRPGRPRKTIN